MTNGTEHRNAGCGPRVTDKIKVIQAVNNVLASSEGQNHVTLPSAHSVYPCH